MASGIAHDINNALSPVSLYTQSLLEREPNLSARTRDYLETIQRSVEDVAHTVARMREFYRQREPQLTLMPVHLNLLVQQVVDLTRARWGTARCGSRWLTTAWAWTRRPAGAASNRSSRRKGSAERDWAWRWSTASPGGTTARSTSIAPSVAAPPCR